MELYPYQVVGVKRLLEGSCLLLDEMGLGKTIQTLVALRILNPRRVLIVCPKSMISVWLREAERVWPESQLQKLPKSWEPSRSSGSVSQQPIARFVTNYEAAPGKDAIFDAFVIDEAHKVKNRHAQRSIWCRRVARKAKFRWLLTGTPISNRADEIWMLLHMADPKTFSSYWRFVLEFCETEASQWSASSIKVLSGLRADKEDDFGQLLAPYVLRRTKADVGLELPAVTRQDIHLPMTPAQTKLHRELLSQLRVEVGEGKTLTVKNVISRIMHARRAAVSPLLFGMSDFGCKFAFLYELLEELKGKHVVVFSQWSQVLQEYADGYEGTTITGETSAALRETKLQTWKERGGVLYVTIGIGGVGLTLTEASYCVFLDQPWNPTETEQAISRLDRIGQTKPVTVYCLFAEDSIEEVVSKANGDKLKLIELVNQQLSKA